jgi:hypothetical protein
MICYPDGKTPKLWSSDALSNYGFDEEKYCFYADGCAVDLSADGTYFTIKSATNTSSLVNIKVIRTAPGIQGGQDGTSYFGTDPQNPWGSMRHRFWPRCEVEGGIITKQGNIDFKGKGMLSHALQGMKPHHAGKVSHYGSPHLLMLGSCQVELRELPSSDILSHYDGFHHSPVVRLVCCECWCHC